MAGVDAVLAEGYVDEDNLFVTGGSGGGVLSAWIVGTEAARQACPMISIASSWSAAMARSTKSSTA